MAGKKGVGKKGVKLASRPPPPPEVFRAAHDYLRALHGDATCWIAKESERAEERGDGCALPSSSTVLDSLVRTMLSQATTDKTSSRAFAKLKRSYPTYAQVLAAPTPDVAEAIREGGLADVKAARIQAVLQTLTNEQQGKEPSLEYLKQCDDDVEVKKQLCRHKGVGAKTAACVCAFALGRAEFPVDVHVWKLSMALGWVGKDATRNSTYDALNACVPDEIKVGLHVAMVEHGKKHGHAATAPDGGLKRAIRESGRRGDGGDEGARCKRVKVEDGRGGGASAQREGSGAFSVKPEEEEEDVKRVKME